MSYLKCLWIPKIHIVKGKNGNMWKHSRFLFHRKYDRDFYAQYDRWDVLTGDLNLIEAVDGHCDLWHGTFDLKYLRWSVSLSLGVFSVSFSFIFIFYYGLLAFSVCFWVPFLFFLWCTSNHFLLEQKCNQLDTICKGTRSWVISLLAHVFNKAICEGYPMIWIGHYYTNLQEWIPIFPNPLGQNI